MADDRGTGSTRAGGLHRRPRSGWRRYGVVALSTGLALVLMAGAAVGVLWWRGEASLDRISVQGLADRVRATFVPDGPAVGDLTGGATPAGDASEDGVPELTEPFVVLVTGLDGDTSGLTAEQRRRVALGGERAGDRPDTIILLRVDPAADQVAMLSLPRDLLVRRCDGSLGKINGSYEVGQALGVGGPTCLVQTITRHTGIAIQNYVEVSFAGFLEVVEAVGGVEMYIPSALYDEKAKLDLQPGCQVLDGPEALAYVRTRNLDSDFGRMARQQAFAKQLLEEVTSAGTLANPLRLYRLVGAAASAVDVDDTLGLQDMRQMAGSLRNLTSERLATASITGDIVTREDLGGASVVEEDRAVTEPIYRAFRSGRLTEGLPSSEQPGAAGSPRPAATVPIENAADVPPVRVLNADGTAGLAARIGELLTSRGFAVAETADARVRHSRSVVQYGPGLESEAETVAQALGGLRTLERIDLRGATAADSGELVVMVGSDLTSASAPDVRGEAPSPAGSPASSSGVAPPTPQPTPEYRGIPAEDRAC